MKTTFPTTVTLPIETERLIVRRLRLEDADDLGAKTGAAEQRLQHDTVSVGGCPRVPAVLA